MKTTWWLVGVLTIIVTGVMKDLLSNQVEAWLPILARRIVRHQAAKMGLRGSRCEEEWLAHLDETHGGLAQLFVALGTIFVPVRTAMERCRDEGFESLATWFRDRAWWITVPAVVLLFFAYPPHPTRYAAYAVLIPFLLFCGLYLAPPFRRAFAQGYERLNYSARVAVGCLMTPVIGYFAIALSLIPVPLRSQTETRVPDRGGKPQAIVFTASLPIDLQRHVASSRVGTARFNPHRVARAHERRRRKNARPIAPLTLPELEPVDLAKLPAVSLQDQPIPPSRLFPPPVAPHSVRIIR